MIHGGSTVIDIGPGSLSESRTHGQSYCRLRGINLICQWHTTHRCVTALSIIQQAIMSMILTRWNGVDDEEARQRDGSNQCKTRRQHGALLIFSTER